MRNLAVLERQREWKHRPSTPPADGTLYSSSAYNLQPNKMSTRLPNAMPTLPRMRRLNTTSSPFSSSLVGNSALGRTVMTAQRRNPPQLAQYSNMSILPTVHLDRPSRHILSERNSRMVGSAVTVKIAPPDVLKPPTPVLLHVERKDTEPEYNPCDTSTVLSAIREKRKRTLREEEATSIDWTQASKRRRQERADTPNGDGPHVPNGGIGMDIGHPQPGGQKRVASQTADLVTEDERTVKRTRRVSGETHGVRNPIDVSYSSSKRWLERKARERSASRSRASSVMSSGSRDTGQPYMSDGHSCIAGSSGTSTPRRSYGLSDDDDDEEMGTYERTSSAADSIVRQTCARLATHSSGQETVNQDDSQRDRSGSRRSTPTPRRYDVRPHSTLIDSIVKVPHLRYDLTVEDYAADRQAEMDRVQQMLSNDMDDDNDLGTNGAAAITQPSIQLSTKTAAPTKSLFATSLPNTATTVTTQAPATAFVLPSMSQPKTATTESHASAGASWASVPSSTTSQPVSTVVATASTTVPSSTIATVPGTIKDSFSASQSFMASASVPSTSKHSFSANQSFGVTTSPASGAASRVPGSPTTTRSPPPYSFKPVFSVPTPPKADGESKPTQSAPSGIGVNTRTPTLETMLRSESPVNASGGSSSQTVVSPLGHGSLFSTAMPSAASASQTPLNMSTPSFVSGSQTLLNGSAETFRHSVVPSAPTIDLGALKKDSTASPFATTSATVNNSTFQFGAPSASSAPMFGASSLPVLNNIRSSSLMFDQNTPVSASKTGSGVAKSLFCITSQPNIFGTGSTSTAPGGGAAFTFGASKLPAASAPQQPAPAFGATPAINGNTVNSAFPSSQNGSASATSSAHGGVFQFRSMPKVTSAPSFTPVFNFNQAPSQASQLAPFGTSANTSQSSTSFTTPFKGFSQNSNAFSVDSPKIPTQASGIFGAPTSTTLAQFGANVGGGASTFGTASEAKPFGVSSSFGSFVSGPTQLSASGVSFGATAPISNASFQFGGSTCQGVFTFGQGQQNAAGNGTTPAFSSNTSFPAAQFVAQPASGNMFSVGTPSTRTRTKTRRRGGRR
ncbi:hypothetical protein LSAT2_026699 [Lamellibrachia satsuma]|nr:hypothetical protein LSAT2_026699 [Lamellibrachia satsuma]